MCTKSWVVELDIVLPEQQSRGVSLYWLGVHTPRTKRLGLFSFLFLFFVFYGWRKARGVRRALPKLRFFSLYVNVFRDVKVLYVHVLDHLKRAQIVIVRG